MSLCYDFQKWTVLTMLAILTVCLVGMVNLVYSQTNDTETRTLKDCTRDLGKLMGLVYLSIDATDTELLELKSYVVNVCNFQYEKTGIYPEVTDEWVTDLEQYKQEFIDEVLNKLSPELKEKLDKLFIKK